MVFAAGKEEDGLVPAEDCRAASSPPPLLLLPLPPSLPRSRLHNFSFPTGSWGVHRTLRCSNLSLSGDPDGSGSMAPAADYNDGAARRRPPSLQEKFFPPTKRSTGVKDLKEGEGSGREEGQAEMSFSSSSAAAAAVAAAAGISRPWNLRTRRAACNAPAENGQCRYPTSAFGSAKKGCLAMEMVKGRSDGSEKGKRWKFSTLLSREEIEQDFLAIKGTKPPRRPKKRPRSVQRQLHSLFPGSCLSEATPEAYKIAE